MYAGPKMVVQAVNPIFAEVLPVLLRLHRVSPRRISGDREDRRWVVEFEDDRNSGVTYVYDHHTGASRLLWRHHPHLPPEDLAPMTPIVVTARDGLALPGYLTRPLEPGESPYPMVLLVHGGPVARDTWRFDPELQFFANRGYAVLQVNYRSSIGSGYAHIAAARGEFAGAMDDDLIDAVEWAEQQGVALPGRTAIYGMSYGGYAVLVGAAFTPGQFAAAIDIVGPSDLVDLLNTAPRMLEFDLGTVLRQFLGDPSEAAGLKDIWDRSPISRVDDIRTPLLVAQGANDTRVPLEQSDRIVKGLRDRGVEVEYLVAEDEGHGFLNLHNRLRLYESVESFLDRHLRPQH